MSTGGGKLHKQMLAQQQAAQAQQNKIFESLSKPTAEQERWNTKVKTWGDWLGKKNYAQAPTGDIIDFDLWNPAHVQQQRERMSDLEGIGAAALGGDTSIALQLARERNANEAAQNAGASYENAVKSRNAYYEGNALPYAQLEIGKLSGLLGNATNRGQFYSNAAIQTRPQSMLPALFGSALSIGSSLLGAPGLSGMFGGGRGMPGASAH